MDIRNPIGLLFTILGIILIGLGTVGDAAAQTAKNTPDPVNINLWWGIAMLVFGLAMFIPAQIAARKTRNCDGECTCSSKK